MTTEIPTPIEIGGALRGLLRAMGIPTLRRGTFIVLSLPTALSDAVKMRFEYRKDASDPMGYWVEVRE